MSREAAPQEREHRLHATAPVEPLRFAEAGPSHINHRASPPTAWQYLTTSQARTRRPGSERESGSRRNAADRRAACWKIVMILGAPQPSSYLASQWVSGRSSGPEPDKHA